MSALDVNESRKWRGRLRGGIDAYLMGNHCFWINESTDCLLPWGGDWPLSFKKKAAKSFPHPTTATYCI